MIMCSNLFSYKHHLTKMLFLAAVLTWHYNIISFFWYILPYLIPSCLMKVSSNNAPFVYSVCIFIKWKLTWWEVHASYSKGETEPSCYSPQLYKLMHCGFCIVCRQSGCMWLACTHTHITLTMLWTYRIEAKFIRLKALGRRRLKYPILNTIKTAHFGGPKYRVSGGNRSLVIFGVGAILNSSATFLCRKQRNLFWTFCHQLTVSLSCLLHKVARGGKRFFKSMLDIMNDLPLYFWSCKISIIFAYWYPIHLSVSFIWCLEINNWVLMK